MSSLNKNTFFKSLMFYFPTLILFLSVLNEIDLNFLAIEYFSFNFAHVFMVPMRINTKHATLYNEDAERTRR